MIYKYKLDFVDEQTIDLPKGAQILSVGNQRESLMLWALVDSNVKDMRAHSFFVVGTGNRHPPASIMRFIGTVQFQGGALVFHVFENMEVRLESTT